MNDTIPILSAPINRPTTINVSGFVARESVRFITDSNRELINRVVKSIQAVFWVSEELLVSKSRKESIAWPRQIAMSLCYNPPGLSLYDVGRHFGGRDHGTVYHAIKRVKERCELEPKCREQFEQVKGRLQ